MNYDLILQPWHQVPFVAIDFETTGLDANKDKPVQLAAVRFENGSPTQRYCTLVDPGIDIPEEATKIHGVSNADVKGAPSLLDAVTELQHRVEVWSAIPVAYNANFDRQFWLFELDFPGLIFDEKWPWMDVLVFIRHAHKFWSGKGRHKLTNVAEKYDIDPGKSHTADADAETCGKVLFSDRMRKILGDSSIAEILRKQREREIEQERDFQEYLTKQQTKDSKQ